MQEREPVREFRGGVIIGRERDDDPIEIVDYDQLWRLRFEELRRQLVDALGPVAQAIEHVGSTAVPGLAAKPVVDVQVSVGDLDDDEPRYLPAIEPLGFRLRYQAPHWRYFRPPPGIPRLFQVHVCQSGSTWERDHLLFRDYLRAHPQRAAEYAVLKRELAARFHRDRIAYNDGKTDFVTQTLRLAEAWARRTGWTT